MRVHAIRTGAVEVHRRQVEGRGTGLRRRAATLLDRGWSASTRTCGRSSSGISTRTTPLVLAGDATYRLDLLLAQRVDGLAPDDAVTFQTLGRLREYVRGTGPCTSRPTTRAP